MFKNGIRPQVQSHNRRCDFDVTNITIVDEIFGEILMIFGVAICS